MRKSSSSSSSSSSLGSTSVIMAPRLSDYPVLPCCGLGSFLLTVPVCYAFNGEGTAITLFLSDDPSSRRRRETTSRSLSASVPFVHGHNEGVEEGIFANSMLFAPQTESTKHSKIDCSPNQPQIFMVKEKLCNNCTLDSTSWLTCEVNWGGAAAAALGIVNPYFHKETQSLSGQKTFTLFLYILLPFRLLPTGLILLLLLQ